MKTVENKLHSKINIPDGFTEIECEACQGIGRVRSGKESPRAITCTACNGYGLLFKKQVRSFCKGCKCVLYSDTKMDMCLKCEDQLFDAQVDLADEKREREARESG